MHRIGLVNPPFASLNYPSLALTQLRSVALEAFPDLEVEICYLHHDFAHHIGMELYQEIANSSEHFVSGVGDWLFRDIAFPESEDNRRDFFLRYYPRHDQRTVRFRRRIREVREEVEDHLLSLIDEYELASCDLVGFTSMFQQQLASLAMARLLKRLRPEIVIALGGANCEWPMGRVVAEHVDAIDYVFSGSALRSFPELLGHLRSGDVAATQSIDGVFTGENRRRWPLAAGSATVGLGGQLEAVGKERPLDEVVHLDYTRFLDDFDRHFPDGSIVPFLVFETSRGCWWGERAHCTFCGLNGQTMAYRAMSPEQAVRQFGRLFELSDRCRHLLCVDNIVPREYLTDVFPRLQPPEDEVIFYEVKSDLGPEDVEILADAGVRLIQPGIEALATSTLRLMRKGVTAPQNIQLLMSCLENDVYPVWNLLVGFPGESGEVYEGYLEILPKLFHLPPPSGVYPVRFDRFSPYFVRAEEFELELEPYDFYQMIYPFDSEDLATLAYYFMDRRGDAEYFRSLVRWIQPLRERIEEWRDAWHRSTPWPPELYIDWRGSGAVVVDSRGAERRERSLDATALEVLAALSEPRRVSEIAKEVRSDDLESTFRKLVAQGLVFEEGGRATSLVFSQRIPEEHYCSTTLRPIDGRVPDDGGFDPRRALLRERRGALVSGA